MLRVILCLILLLSSFAIAQESLNISIVSETDLYGPQFVAVRDTLAYVIAKCTKEEIQGNGNPEIDYQTMSPEAATCFKIVNVADPKQPRQIKYFSLPNKGAGQITISGDYAYIVDHARGITIVDISDLNSFFSVWHNIANPNDVAVTGNYLFVAANDPFGLHIYKVLDPALMDSIVGCGKMGLATGVTIKDNYAYVSSPSFMVQVFDITNPNNPTSIKTLYKHISFLTDMTASGNYLYLTSRNEGLRVVGISNPLTPAEVGSVSVKGTPMNIAVSGNYAFIAADEGGLRVVNVADPTDPKEVGYIELSGLAKSVSVVGNLAYTANGSKFFILDCSEAMKK
jgi:hypothetical protein